MKQQGHAASEGGSTAGYLSGCDEVVRLDYSTENASVTEVETDDTEEFRVPRTARLRLFQRTKGSPHPQTPQRPQSAAARRPPSSGARRVRPRPSSASPAPRHIRMRGDSAPSPYSVIPVTSDSAERSKRRRPRDNGHTAPNNERRVPAQYFVHPAAIRRQTPQGPSPSLERRFVELEDEELEAEIEASIAHASVARASSDGSVEALFLRVHNIVRFLRRSLEAKDGQVSDLVTRIHVEKRTSEDLSAECDHLRQHIDALSRRHVAAEKEWNDEVARAHSMAEVEKDHCRKQLSAMRMKVKRVQEENRRKDELIAHMEQQRVDDLGKTKKDNKETVRLELQVKKLQYELAKKNGAIASLTSARDRSQQKVDEDARKELEDLQKKVKVLQVDVERKERFNSDLKQQVSKLTEDYANTLEENQKRNKWKDQCQELRRDLMRKDEHLRATSAKLNKVQHENIDLTLEIEQSLLASPRPNTPARPAS